MKKNLRSIITFSTLILTSGAICTSICFGLVKAVENSNIPYKEETFEIINPNLKAYLDAKTSPEQFAVLNNYSASRDGYYDKPIIPTITFNGNDNEPYTVNISKDNFATSRIISTSKTTFTISDPIPGVSYTYEVTDKDNFLIAKGKANIKDDYSVRYMNIVSSFNVRDSGGWNTANGNKVRYGMMYRGGRLNSGETIVQADQIRLYNEEMGVKSEIDLRNKTDDIGQRNAVFAEKSFGGYSKNYIRDLEHSFGNYDGFFTKETRTQVNKIFTYLTDESNYPFYTHCSAGADRTGSLCLTLNAILGVSYDDLVRDFELTNFSPIGRRRRAASNADNSDFDYSKAFVDSDGMVINFPIMISKFRSFGEETDSFETCVYNYLTTPIDDGGCGVTDNDINIYRSIMLNLERKTEDSRNVFETCTTGGVAIYEYEGHDLVVETKPLNHDFYIGENHVVCKNCHESYVVSKVDIDASKEYDFGKNAKKVTFINGDELTLENGKANISLDYAFEGTTPIVVTKTNGTESVLLANIYSSIINDANDFKDMNNHQLNCIDSDGNIYQYGNFKLNSDIDLYDGFIWNKENALGFSRVTSSKTGFKGTFDGNKHTINNFVTSGQDGALVYNLSGGSIKNLTLKGKANDTFWGNDFLCAYTYFGEINNIYLEVELGNGTAIYHNTALLGTIGFNETLQKDIVVNNVSINGVNSTNVKNSNGLGMLFKTTGLEYGFRNHLKLNNVTISEIKNLLVMYSKDILNYQSIDDLDQTIKVIGKENINNLIVQ